MECKGRARDAAPAAAAAAAAAAPRLLLQQHYMRVLQYGGGVAKIYDRLIGGSRLIHFRLRVQSPDAPSDFTRLISGYRLTQTALWWDP